MTHKEINEIQDPNLKKIMQMIKMIEKSQKQIRKAIKNVRDERTNDNK